MKINFAQHIATTLGQPIMLDDKKTPATLADVVAIALSAGGRDPLPPEESYKRGKLAQLVMKGGEIDLKAEDIVLAKKAVGQHWAPGVVAPAWDALEPS